MKWLNDIVENILSAIVIIAIMFFIFVVCNPLAWVGLFLIYLITKG